MTELQAWAFDNPYFGMYVLERKTLDDFQRKMRAFMAVEHKHLQRLWMHESV